MSSTPPSQQSGGSRPAQPASGPGAHFGRGTRIEKAQNVRGTLFRLLSELKPYWPALSVVFLLVAISTLLGLASPYLMAQAIDRFAQGNRQELLRIVIWMLLAYLGSWLAGLIEGLIVANVTQRVMRNMRRQLFEHLQTLSLRFFDRHPHGELMSRLTNDLDAISRVIAQNATQLFSGALTLTGILIMMLILNFWLTLGSMFVFPLMLWLVGFVGRRTRKGYREFQMRIGELNGQLEEMFSGQRVIMAFGQQASTMDKFNQVNAIVRQVGVQAQSYSMLVPPLMGILSNANIAIVAGLGGWMALNGWASVGTIAAFISYSRTFANPLRHLGDLYNQIQAAIAGAERVFELMDQKPDMTDAPDALPLDDLHGHIEFDHVDFGYVRGVPVIKDMSFDAAPGQMIALVGPTGAGKTTMVNLLSRFYDIDSGSIRVDGTDIRQFKKADLRRQLGVVLQDTYLFSDTVMENIRYGRLGATDDDVIAAAQLANADQFIRRLPHSYDTMLSERAGNISQGQRQLLAIARAVLADPGILILDEATSSVDTRTEMLIQEGLLRLMEGRTSFVIAHRLSTIREADNILVINDGEIIEQGTHDELLDRQGFYYNLYMSQFKGKGLEIVMNNLVMEGSRSVAG
ncbi:MAG: ABC transporter ATP-binding protein [Anaerolineae bacterium]|nr:ABC transporter ATP-binding protein [Anaerolineae bacterium]